LSIYNLIDNDKHLPEIMKDFHDQKDVIKSMYAYYNQTKSNKVRCNSVDLHIDIVDHFLEFMFIHGYKLQKTRIQCDNNYCDILETISARKEKESTLMKELIADLNTNLTSD
jgi:hypothetical protein